MIFLLVLMVSCKKKEVRVIDSPQQGEITMQVDESFASVSEALTDRYMALYPGTKINLEIKKKQDEIHLHKNKIAELTNRARSIKDLLFNLKKY